MRIIDSDCKDKPITSLTWLTVFGMVALKGFKRCKRWSLRDLDHELANPWDRSSNLQKLHDDIRNQCAGRLSSQFCGFDSSPQQSGTSRRRKDRNLFHFICISMSHCFLKQSHGQTHFLRYTAFHDHNSITTPAQLRLLASAPTANCRRSSKKEPSEVKEEDHSSVKQDEGSDDEEGGEQKDEVDDVQVRDIRYNLETLSKNQSLVGVVNYQSFWFSSYFLTLNVGYINTFFFGPVFMV